MFGGVYVVVYECDVVVFVDYVVGLFGYVVIYDLFVEWDVVVVDDGGVGVGDCEFVGVFFGGEFGECVDIVGWYFDDCGVGFFECWDCFGKGMCFGVVVVGVCCWEEVEYDWVFF